jgi:hypothetical protein
VTKTSPETAASGDMFLRGSQDLSGMVAVPRRWRTLETVLGGAKLAATNFVC